MGRSTQSVWVAMALALVACTLAGCGSGSGQTSSTPATAGTATTPPQDLSGIHKIQHVVVIMQENRSFDSYFGTYPGADGIPGLAGNPGTVPCLPQLHGSCTRPFHDRNDLNMGGPHGVRNGVADIDGGLMDGFVIQQQKGI